MARTFVDTNILIYSAFSSDREKQAIAKGELRRLSRAGEGVISSQVLNEFASNSLKKLLVPAWAVAIMIDGLADLSLIQTTIPIVQDALEISTLASISYWDACIVASARSAGCTILMTEDLNHGQLIGGVLVHNPFR